MRKIDFIGAVELFRKPQFGKAVALIIAIALLAIVLVVGLLNGQFAMLVLLLPFGAAIAGVRKVTTPTEVRRVPMSMSLSGGVFRLEMAEARLFDERYVNQYYLCAAEDIDLAAFDANGNFRLRARTMQSFASNAGHVLDHRTNTNSEITFQVDQETRTQIEAFLNAEAWFSQECIGSTKGATMEKELFDYVAERVDILSVSGASTQVTKDAALAWKEAVAADASEEAVEAATTALLDILEGRPTTIDEVIAFAQGPAASMFGEEAAAQMLAAQKQRKEEGAKYCNCEACTAASELLAKFGRIEL